MSNQIMHYLIVVNIRPHRLHPLLNSIQSVLLVELSKLQHGLLIISNIPDNLEQTLTATGNTLKIIIPFEGVKEAKC